MLTQLMRGGVPRKTGSSKGKLALQNESGVNDGDTELLVASAVGLINGKICGTPPAALSRQNHALTQRAEPSLRAEIICATV